LQPGKDLIRSRRYAEAVQFFTRAARRLPKDSRPYYYLGVCQHHLRQPAKSLAAYQQAIRRKPQFFELWNNYGATLLDLGQGARAIRPLEQAARLRPKDASLWYNLGLAYGDAGQLPQAARAFERSLGLRPRHLNSRNALIEVLTQLGRYQLALQQLKELSRQALGAGAGPRLRLRLTLRHAVLLARLKREPAALAALAAATKLAPNSLHLHFTRGMVHLRLGQPGQAIPALRRALAMKPGNPSLLLALGRAQTAAGHYGPAIKTLQAAQRVAKGRLRSLPYYLAEAHRLAGRCGRAKPLYQRVLKSRSTGPLARKARAGLKACP
jgi:tetratricopeptide (TPR) repeat protein